MTQDYTVGTDDAVCYECEQDTQGKWYYLYNNCVVICSRCYGKGDDNGTS